MRMEDGWCCGAEGEHIVEGKNQQDIIKSMSNIKVCHCSKCRHWLSRWVDLSWKMAKSLMYMKMRLIRITKGITLNNIKPKKGKFYEIIICKRKKGTCS